VTGSDVPHGESRLGLPERGPGSVAGWGRRVAALLVDWAVANVVALLVVRTPAIWDGPTVFRWAPFVAWVLITTAGVALVGASPGHWLLRLRVVGLDGRPVGLWRALVRTAMIAAVIPPLVLDRDGRGVHDVAVGTALVRGPW
jgi:uncharacterized RDD family membrane protein YckC